MIPYSAINFRRMINSPIGILSFSAIFFQAVVTSPGDDNYKLGTIDKQVLIERFY